MGDKYYIPDISEIYVGFEYEYRIFADKNTTIILDNGEVVHNGYSSWIKSNNFKEEEVDSIDKIEWMLERKMELIRVKYLDKEDIKKLNWKFMKIYAGTTESYFEIPNTDWCLDFDPDFKGRIYVRISQNCDGDNTFFSGTIKNKNEFKKIMQQIGITK